MRGRNGRGGRFSSRHARFNERLQERFENRRGRIQRARNGAVFGVLSGLARTFDLNLFWLRIIYVVLTLATGVWPGLLIYILAAALMKPEPARPPESPAEEEFYDDYARSRDNAIQRAKRKFESIEKRIRRLEHTVTSRGYDFDQRLRRKGE
ncbi:MAG: phage shock protein [Desulfovibrionales bacterium]|jgi:phage shock protein C|nr:phage shock protein [Desulfovibrionales bacterium]